MSFTIIYLFRALGFDLTKKIEDYFAPGHWMSAFLDIIVPQARMPRDAVACVLSPRACFLKFLQDPFLRIQAQRLCVGDVNLDPDHYIPRDRIAGRIVTSRLSMEKPTRHPSRNPSPFHVSQASKMQIRVDNSENLEFWLSIDISSFVFPRDHPIHLLSAKWMVSQGRISCKEDDSSCDFWVSAYFDSSFTRIRCNCINSPTFWLILELHHDSEVDGGEVATLSRRRRLI